MSIFNELVEISDSVAGLSSELRAIYAYNLFNKLNKSVVVLNGSLFEANKIFQSISKYTDDVLFFPMDDFLTSEALAISPEFQMTRLETLDSILKNEKKIVVTNLMGFLRYLPDSKIYNDHFTRVSKGVEIDILELTEELINNGYKKESTVSSSGDIAVRGYIVDIFPISSLHPVRIEFWGNEVESIREFDENTQLTLKNLDDIRITPATEFIVNSEIDKTSYSDIKNHIKVENICGYFNNYAVLYNGYNSILNEYKLLIDEMNNYDPNKKFMFNIDEINVKDEYYIYDFDNEVNSINYNSWEILDFPKKIDEIKKLINEYINNKKTVIICLNDQYKLNKVLEIFENAVITDENNIFNNKINLIIKKIVSGFIVDKYIFISEKELFNKKSESKYKSNFKLGKKIRNINKLSVGDYIVHVTFGIGKYLGIKTLEKNGIKKDYLTLEYKNDDKLYIPVEKIDMISKFSSGDGLAPKINKLGGSEWETTKRKVQKRIKSLAFDLINLYAKRKSSLGFKYLPDDEDQIEFEKEFEFNETIDQIKSTEEIKKDMESNRPMDRLLCGDVGFGKTEVAFRAIMKAVLSGKQTAILCPTTILSSQHFNNAIERFSSFAVNIALLNRFVTEKNVTRIKKELKNGEIDILIGTHKILGDEIIFDDLGLLIVDEEQRFGVNHKEKIKTYKNNVDVLTLSATPIPRTLQMSMMGIRDLSLIETPPINRYPVQTYVMEENNYIIKDAIYKELARNGQVFVLYNHVNEIRNKVSEISKLVPEARICFAHGRMSKSELEDVMLKFMSHEYDVLVCTTIIETGIDIANANTLIILEADHFGLSQLYQIRGRVGRSNKIAYCYLMYKVGKSLTDVAKKRLNVIKEFTELGSGFAIATRDLSIRGAGDVIGSDQAGFIDTVGIDLYLKMLEDEIKRLNGQEVVEEPIDHRTLLDVATYIDDKYVAIPELKIEIHKKINEIDSFDKLNKIKVEIEDRFGKLDENMIIYMYEEWFEKIARKLKIKRVRQTNNFIEVQLPKELTDRIDGKQLFFDITDISKNFRFSQRQKELVVTLDIVNSDKHFIYNLIELVKAIDNLVVE